MAKELWQAVMYNATAEFMCASSSRGKNDYCSYKHKAMPKSACNTFYRIKKSNSLATSVYKGLSNI